MGKEEEVGKRKVSSVHFDDREIGSANSLSSVMSHLSDIPPHDRRFLEGYARAQLFLREGRLTKASTVLKGLQSSAGFQEFSESNSEVLRVIKHLVDKNSRNF